MRVDRMNRLRTKVTMLYPRATLIHPDRTQREVRRARSRSAEARLPPLVREMAPLAAGPSLPIPQLSPLPSFRARAVPPPSSTLPQLRPAFAPPFFPAPIVFSALLPLSQSSWYRDRQKLVRS